MGPPYDLQSSAKRFLIPSLPFHHMRGKPQFGESAVLQEREYRERTVQPSDTIVKTVEYMGMTVNGTFQQPR